MARDIVSDDENASDRWEDIDEQDLSNLFEYNGMPLKVHLHSSLRSSEYQIRVIRDTLEAHGADPYVKLEDARFIIVNPYKNDFKRLLEEYSACPCVWIVRPGWVQKCIRYKTVIEARGRFKNIAYGKRYDDGEQRVRFTKRDDENMTRYLASRSPLVNWDQNDDQRKSRFKRAGKKVYEDLVRSDRLWASRHSLESWRNRYTKNMDHFDECIEKHVANERPELLNDFDMRMEMDLRDDQMVDSDTEEGEGWDEEVPPLPRQAIAFMKEKDLLPSRRGPSPGKEDPRSDAYVLDSSSESEEERVESDSEEDIPQVRPSRRVARRTRVAEDDEQEDRGWVEELVGDQRQSEERNWEDDILRVPNEYRLEEDENVEPAQEENNTSQRRLASVAWPPQRPKRISTTDDSQTQEESDLSTRSIQKRIIEAAEPRPFKRRAAESITNSSQEVSSRKSLAAPSRTTSHRASDILEDTAWVNTSTRSSQLRRNYGIPESGLLSPPKTQLPRATQPSPRSLPRFDLSQPRRSLDKSGQSNDESRIMTRRRAKQKAALEA